jgi:hypothetical protein
VSTCDWCGRTRQLRDGLCFGCRIKTIGLYVNGGTANWNDDMSYTAQAKEIEDHARASGTDITKVK